MKPSWINRLSLSWKVKKLKDLFPYWNCKRKEKDNQYFTDIWERAFRRGFKDTCLSIVGGQICKLLNRVALDREVFRVTGPSRDFLFHGIEVWFGGCGLEMPE